MTAPVREHAPGSQLLAPGSRLSWLALASALVACGLALVYTAKSHDLGSGKWLNLNTVRSAEELLPYVEAPVAERIFARIERVRPLRNFGALIPGNRGLAAWGRLKPLWIVRTPAEFRRAFLRACALYFAGFWVVALVWRWRGFQGDRSLLVALHLLTGIGLILMVSLRDPLRDTLEFSKFSWGVFGGCLLLLAPLLRACSYRRLAGWCYTPLFAALLLFALLVRFGSGPSGSDSKVNLGPFQPVEPVKLLLVLFLAGYFTRKWEHLRDLPGRLRWRHVAPVLTAVALALTLFFLLKDLGPALVTSFLFLALFAVARSRPGLALAGVALMAGGVAAGYYLGRPPTVAGRIGMWLSPWDNNVRGGDQLANSLWALATGGPWGSGPGWGDPVMIPAGHTDLVLPAIGEEWGFAGVASVFLLCGFLVSRAFRIARRAADEHGFFLAAGLGGLLAFEMLLITAGVLGALPLSGVVSPFLSSGNTAMLANFAAVALLASVAHHGTHTEASKPFLAPLGRLQAVFLGCALVLAGFAAWYQLLRDRDTLARPTRVFTADGVKRALLNPRIRSLAREIPRGAIYDRNGVVLASGNRQYPYPLLTSHFLGDLRSGENFHATNASLIEHDYNVRLQGFSDYRELLPLIRVRHQPGNPGMEALRARPRDVHTTLDIRLQEKLDEIMAPVRQGAAVVLDARSGDILALLSRPEDGIDRARYGLYPPGSTFKLVTATAALRKEPALAGRVFHCTGLGNGRAGARIPGWNRPIYDDIHDSAHGAVTMERAIAVSCNAYFAQLGVFAVGSQAIQDTAALVGMRPGDLEALRPALPFAAYGQGPVLVSPVHMARVAAAVAAGGTLRPARWVSNPPPPQPLAPSALLDAGRAAFLARAMRRVVTEGTARRAMQGLAIPVAGKTGTAQLDTGEPHAWFAGFAPYGRECPIAFAVVVEHGGYGARAAAPLARRIVEAAAQLGVIR